MPFKATHIITGKTSRGDAFSTMGTYNQVLAIHAKHPAATISRLTVAGDPQTAEPTATTEAKRPAAETPDPTAGVDPKILADLAAINITAEQYADLHIRAKHGDAEAAASLEALSATMNPPPPDDTRDPVAALAAHQAAKREAAAHRQTTVAKRI